MITLAALWVVLATQRDTLASPRVLDSFERITAWSAHPADGVRMSLHEDHGHMRLDFSFAAGGYAVARRALPIELPANYAFSIRIRGVARPNTLEFKLIDSTGGGDNVWWYTERDRDFDGKWHRLTIRKRQIAFAWGPRGGGELAHAAFLELVITAGKGGGSGSVWFDDLTLVPLPVVRPYAGTPVVTASQAEPTHPAAAILDADSTTAWRSGPVKEAASLTVDFGAPREFGGLTLGWEAGLAAASYDVWLSDDARSWRLVRRVRQVSATRTDHLYLPDSEGRYLRFTLQAPAGRGYGLREVTVEPLEFGASRNAFFQRVAHTVPPGTYPRYFLGERTPWTVIGGDGSHAKGLINSDGAIDVGSGGFSLEPLIAESSLVTWNDVTTTAALEDRYLPIPSVTWTAGTLSLTITAASTGSPDHSRLMVRYRLRNTGPMRRRPTLDLAVRPFQVNPPWQFLGTPGGAARVDSIRWTGKAMRVGNRTVVPLVPPSRVGASTFDAGEIVERLRRGDFPGTVAARDSFGAASAVLAYRLDLPPGDSADVGVVIPLAAAADRTTSLNGALVEAATRWQQRLAAVDLTLPALPTLPDAMRSSAGWILASRKGAALEPGTRSYDRSWIRDGVLMSAALLRFGYDDVVRDYIEWYAPHQYPNGKIPCCVDARGADPVPEHDSNGEFIYLVMEYWRFTHDRALLERVWPRVVSAVAYLDSLRHTERVPPFVGLLPPSISHEGYSAKPMHSYWDDFFALRGFKDATVMAQVLGHDEEARRFARIRDEFSNDLHHSIDLAMSEHHIDFIPGAADLGDFDATSTTIALSPVQDASRLPRVALERTFVKYWDGVTARRGDTTWDGYAGYEIRAVGAMLRLGWKSRALSLLQWFLDAREPPAWNQWPEVIYRDPRAPKFVGDMPHAWVAADFLRSASDLFAFERESDSALVIGAGLDSTWLADAGLKVSLRTWWGRLAYAARREEDGLHIRIDPGVTVPPGGIVVCSPLSGLEGAVVVRELPADIRFTH